MMAMHLDAIDLKDFYASPLGGVVRRLLGARLRARWSNLHGQSLFGLGFATPYLGSFRSDACPCGALMPAELGVISWPREGKCLSVLVDETDLPLPDECADRVLLVHMLESTNAPARCCASCGACWRKTKATHPRAEPSWLVGARQFHTLRLRTPVQSLATAKLLKDAMFSPKMAIHLYMPPSPGASCSNGRCSGSGSASCCGQPSPA